MRPLKRVPDAAMLDDLLEDLRRHRQHMALVVDEHGSAVGAITLEDVLEEIVGDIEDEFDADRQRRRRPADHSSSGDGGIG